MSTWKPYPHDSATFRHDAAALKKHWPRLHVGDKEPLPKDGKLLAAWGLYHAGDFRKAFDAANALGSAGITLANKAQAYYAQYLEPNDKNKLAMFQEVMERASAQQTADPKNPNAHYLYAYALGRYAQGISIAKALTQGLAPKLRRALEATLKLAPEHANAHLTLGTFHAEVIDKVGKLLGKAQGADTTTGLQHLAQALELNPDAAFVLTEVANGRVMLEGNKRMKEAEQLYAKAAACVAHDAIELLDVEAAKAELE